MADRPEPSLAAARHKFLQILIQRARMLRLSQPPPESFYVGQQYVEDQNRIDCTISVGFVYPGMIEPGVLWYRKSQISIRQKPPVLIVSIKRKIAACLWDDIRLFGWGGQFIVGYVNTLMPVVNRRLLDNRYLSGQPLSRTYSLLDAIWLVVTHQDVDVPLNWPVAVSPFPRSAQLAPGRDEPYLRDFVDAIHAYFWSDFDDCIRRLVTSVETFFAYRKWKASRAPSTFRRILDHNVETKSLSGEVVVENLKYIYKIRNRIVHGGFRMSPASGLFCDKAIATVRYLIQRYSGDPAVSRYAHSHGMQFLGLQRVVGQLYDLDKIQRGVGVKADGPPIENMAQMDEFMFKSLRFKDHDKQSIL